jgi:hypothetical protein
VLAIRFVANSTNVLLVFQRNTAPRPAKRVIGNSEVIRSFAKKLKLNAEVSV